MKKVSILGVMFIALVAFQGVASAQTVSGKIDKIDAAANKLSISTADPAASKVEISVSATTSYSGAASLADLTVGQEVSVEATEDAASKGLSATSVKVAEPVAPAPPAEGAAKEPAM